MLARRFAHGNVARFGVGMERATPSLAALQLASEWARA